jgi:hypothetical protein
MAMLWEMVLVVLWMISMDFLMNSTKVGMVLVTLNDEDTMIPMEVILHDLMIQEDKIWREDLMKW